MTRTIASVLLLVIASNGTWQRSVPRVADDQAVYAAVLNDTIRPEVMRLFSSRASIGTPLLLVADRTVALCGAARAPEMACVRPEELAVFAKDASSTGRVAFDALLDTAVRSELAAAFKAENAEVHPMPKLEIPEARLLTAEDLQQESARLQSGQSRGFSGFSRPAYSADGHALVYGFYICGNLCAHGWFFLLDRHETAWRVLAAHMLWIS